MTTTSESLLFRLQQLGESPDEAAWEKFVSLYAPLIFHWARKTGLERDGAADLVQDVLVQAFRKLPQLKYDATKSFKGWLRMVTLNRYREIRRRKTIQLQSATDSLMEKIAPVEVAESTWDIDYAKLLVAKAMNGMKDDFKPATWQALERLIKDAQPVDVVAKEVGISPWTVYSARSRLTRRLREELDGLL